MRDPHPDTGMHLEESKGLSFIRRIVVVHPLEDLEWEGGLLSPCAFVRLST